MIFYFKGMESYKHPIYFFAPYFQHQLCRISTPCDEKFINFALVNRGVYKHSIELKFNKNGC